MIRDTLKRLQEILRVKCAEAWRKPKIGLILGSGLGEIADEVAEALRIPYARIPHFVRPTVEGHAGEMVIGKFGGKAVCIMNGRPHLYEGYTMKEITYPIRVMAGLGIESLIITGASGGINEDFEPGDIVLITDHINLMGDNPLIGEKIGGRTVSFTNMKSVYDKTLIGTALTCAKALKIKLHRGVYIAVRGPSYETPAEIEMARRVGADLVGMSVAPEAIVGKHLGLKILGISCVTNKATSKQAMSHPFALKVAKEAKGKVSRLLKEVVKRI